ncbi:MAG: fumarylacetoacetate hydrolase family protein [Burkholderiales bacterium]|nr:fumarylacetoacetate hydrolase family protein [Burkholderiales bacterium]
MQQDRPSTPDELARAAELFTTLIRLGGHLATLPGARPETLADAYAVQDAIVARMGPVGGWKVSPLRTGDEPRCSPLPLTFFHDAPAVVPAGVLSGCLAEVEVAVRLGSDLPAPDGAPSTRAVAAAIASIHAAVELLSSRFDSRVDAPDLHRLADLQNCAGVVVGPGLRDWSDVEVSVLPLGLALDAERHRAETVQPTTERTLAAIGWLAAHAHRRGLPLRAGQVIITGARLGPVAIGQAGKVVATVGSLAAVEIRGN